ncbi:unnamed protein product [Amoebophrya sp. A25]|nr:unnamed protein product [Amoebophrya sp. A25]|eukprot:GSA25T00013244001.1
MDPLLASGRRGGGSSSSKGKLQFRGNVPAAGVDTSIRSTRQGMLPPSTTGIPPPGTANGGAVQKGNGVKNGQIQLRGQVPITSKGVPTANGGRQLARVGAPPYGHRADWAPKTVADFGDGGAFPEILIPQYPLNMGKSGFVKHATQSTGASNSKTIALQTDAGGKVAYDAIARQGLAAEKLAVHTRPDSMKEKWSRADALVRPDAEIDAVNTSRTQLALQAFLAKKVSAGSKSLNAAAESQKANKASFIKYTPNEDAPGYNPDAANRVIKVMQKPVDPFEPPKFKHKKVPKGPGTPPPPRQHSPPRKLTAADQKAWIIPPCVSNWKNNRGYTIPLDKRIAADGRNLQDTTLSEAHSEMAESLYQAEMKNREEVQIRANLARQRKLEDAATAEEEMKKAAREAREAQTKLTGTTRQRQQESKDEEDRKYREQIAEENRREVERQFRLDKAGNKRSGRDRDADRDVSERVALGQQVQPTRQETLYDTRLMNQDAGMDSGYGGDEKYQVYEKPLFTERTDNTFYKHDKDRLEAGTRGVNFEAHREAEANRVGVSVQFERDETHDEEDAFGVDRMYKRAKRE